MMQCEYLNGSDTGSVVLNESLVWYAHLHSVPFNHARYTYLQWHTHEVRKDSKHVQLSVFVRHQLVLAVQELAHQDV